MGGNPVYQALGHRWMYHQPRKWSPLSLCLQVHGFGGLPCPSLYGYLSPKFATWSGNIRAPVGRSYATMQKGPIGFVPIGRGNGTPACFVGYVFRVGGSTYTGLFALYGRSEDVDRFCGSFTGGSVLVRYNPASPEISYLNELNDPRFGPLTSTQNPQHLAQAPSFDLQDVMNG